MEPSDHLVLVGKGITTFWGIKDAISKPLISIDLRNNGLTSFDHFGTHDHLVELNVENNQISSLLGLTKQRSLKVIKIAGNPIARHPHYRVMLLLTVGFSIATIDGTPVDAADREAARRLGPNAALATSYGWHLDVVPRTPSEFDAIIAELRDERRRRNKQARDFVTIPAVLQDLRANIPDPDANKEEVQNRALVHLSQRVVQLEQQLAQAHNHLRLQRAAASENLRDTASLVSGLTPTDIATLHSIRFEASFASNLQGGQEPKRCLVEVGQLQLVIRHIFTHAPLCECSFAEINGVSVASPTVTVQSSGGLLLWVSLTTGSGALAFSKCLMMKGVVVDLSCFGPAATEKLHPIVLPSRDVSERRPEVPSAPSPSPSPSPSPKDAVRPAAAPTATVHAAATSPPAASSASPSEQPPPPPASVDQRLRQSSSEADSLKPATPVIAAPPQRAQQLESSTATASSRSSTPPLLAATQPQPPPQPQATPPQSTTVSAAAAAAASATAPASTSSSVSTAVNTPVKVTEAVAVASHASTPQNQRQQQQQQKQPQEKQSAAAKTDDTSSDASSVKPIPRRRREMLKEIMIDSDSDSD